MGSRLISQSQASMESRLEPYVSVSFVQHQIGLSLTLVFIFISFYNSDQVQVALWYNILLQEIFFQI